MKKYSIALFFFLLISCDKDTQEKSNEIQSIEGVSCQVQITSGLDQNNRPVNNVDYFPPQLGKAYAFVNFDKIPNGKHTYQCRVSKGDQKDIYALDTYNIEVTNGENRVWSWVDFKNLTGPGDLLLTSI